MAAAETISNTLPPTQNFDYLREKGLQYIQQLSGKLWTDHNLHDPGITILEVLCYALIDLGYRTDFGINDIITKENGKPADNAFHTAADIFPTAPVTIIDYRKLLIDIEGIRNAWLLVKDEDGLPFEDSEPIYGYCDESRLLFESEIDTVITNFEKRAHVRNNERVRPTGLYSVKLDMDEHPLYGDLNSAVVATKFLKGVLNGFEFEFIFPEWFTLDKDGKELASLFTAPLLASFKIELINDTQLKEADFKNLQRKNWKTEWTIKYGTEQRVLSPVKVKLLKAPTQSNGLVKGADLLKGLEGTELKEAFNRFKKRPVEIFRLFGKVREKLMQHRNLCEDFLYDLRNAETEDLGICVDLDVDLNADLESIQSDVFLAVENYLLPPVQFSTLPQLLEDGVPVEKIFDGPLLEHGFLTDEEVQKSSLKSTFYTSDIISLLMDLPGVLNVRNFSVAVYENDVLKPQPANGKIIVSPNHKLRLAREKCKLMFYKKGLPLLANYQESINKLRLKTSLQNHRKQHSFQHDLLIPAGKYRDLGKHYSILNEFPRVYGLGEKDLPESVTQERKAQVKQLEAYLTFTDQLIAGFFAQLNDVKNLLSWNSNVKHSYLTQYFYTDADAASIFNHADFIGSNKGLQSIVENDATFRDRRNRLLDHLVARFAESFNDYALYMYALPDEMVLDDIDVSKKLIDDKIALLNQYPVLSMKRATAFNYAVADADPLATTNLSGYARRMRSLLGMKNETSKPLQNLDDDDFGGFHLLEHFLLRPFNTDTSKLSVCLDLNCDHCGDEDPYSFKISIILPFWLKRFVNMEFRNYMESMFRAEAPAHIFLKICWVDRKEMKEYEDAYAAWAIARAAWFAALPVPAAAVQSKYTKALNKLIEVLEGLRTDFPVATLHDCEDRDELNDIRVFLSSTQLGTFKPTHEDGNPIPDS